jgi:hypothetical protein
VPQKRGSAANIAQLTNAFSNASSLLSTGGQRENDHRLVKVARSMIDEDTLSELEAMFTSMDTTGDGQLTREDFVRAPFLAPFFGSCRHSPSLSQRWRKWESGACRSRRTTFGD